MSPSHSGGDDVYVGAHAKGDGTDGGVTDGGRGSVGDGVRDGSDGASGGGKKGKKQKKRWDTTSKVLLVIGIILLAIALGILGYIAGGYLSARQEYEDVREMAGIDAESFDSALDGDTEIVDLDIDWDALQAINPDICGWIYVQGTDINYPIVQGDDNDYYLHHSFEGTVSSSGAIFLDCDNSSDFSDMHNVLYGHHMRDGSMFKQITLFKDQDFLDNGYEVLVLTPSTAYVLQPAFTYICEGGSSEYLRKFEFEDEEALQEYMAERMESAISQASVDMDGVDKMFSLVTCSYEADNVRTVLCCVPADVVTFPNGS